MRILSRGREVLRFRPGRQTRLRSSQTRLRPLLGEDQVGPPRLLRPIIKRLPNDLTQHLHPLVLEGATIGVEIDRLAVGEADTETFLDVLVALVFLGESGAATTLGVGVGGGGRVGDERGLVVDEARGLGQVDDGAFLMRVLVVGGEFGVLEAEEAAAPVLYLSC